MEKHGSLSCPVCHIRHVPISKATNGVCAATCENCGHFFKFKAVTPYKTDITFTVNGQQYTVGNDFGPSASLNDFLRQKHISVGTKVLCKQGGCGICIVVAKMTKDPAKQPVTVPVNSCLCPVHMCEGWEITTIEGLGSTKTTMHPIQKAVADFGGTQCGYCTPGQIMNMYGLTKKFPTLTKQVVEDHFEGNLCRCTGYRPILDAMKSLVPPTDIEDLTQKLCKTTGQLCASGKSSCGGRCGGAQQSDSRAVRMVFGAAQWFKPTTVADLNQILHQQQGKKIRILGANTGTGPFPDENIANFEVLIDISGVADLFENSFEGSSGTFTLGANVTLTELMDLFTAQASQGSDARWEELKKYLYRVASFPIRSRGTWAGNLMMKNKYRDFQSDLFNIFTALKATLTIGNTPSDFVTVDAFYSTDMTGKCLSKVKFMNFTANDVVSCYKVMPRSQNSLALVSGAFRCSINKVQGYMVTDTPVISLAGISPDFHRASKTEQYLYGKQLSSPSTLSGALTVLASEISPNVALGLPSPDYRRTVACALLYKFFLVVLGNDAGVRNISGKDVLHDIRPLSSGTQTYDTNQQMWPVDKPVKKLEANVQTTGEAVYTDDLLSLPGQLYASFVLSTVANATISNIDTSAALNVTGVVKVLTASDIPANAVNNIVAPIIIPPEFQEILPEELLCSSKVEYCGQSVALVLAESQDIADSAAKLVNVTYTNVQKPLLTLDEGVAAGSFFRKQQDLVTGDPEGAMASAPMVTQGSFQNGSQFHFHMETQATNCAPTEEGLELVTSSQYMEHAHQAISNLTGLHKSKIKISVKRLGGAFGAKSTRNSLVAAACGLGCLLTNRPVRMRMNIQTNMQMLGGRLPHRFDYKIGHDQNGKLLAAQVDSYYGVGYLPNDSLGVGAVREDIDNVYSCANWKVSFSPVKLNTAASTYCRGPGYVPAVMSMETIMEHVARTVARDPVDVKTLNLYQKGQVTPAGMTLANCNIRDMMTQVLASSQLQIRKQVLDYFNRDNRWKKKALSVVPMKYGIGYTFANFPVTLSVHNMEGSVSVNTGGIEMGQGLNTKVAQVVAYELGIPMDMITVTRPNTEQNPNSIATGGSVGSEECCKGAIECCTAIKAQMAPVKATMDHPTWEQLVQRCTLMNVKLSANYTVLVPPPDPTVKNPPADYECYGACCTEVELDVLTGEYQVNRVDMLYDCGQSLNPAVDIGQAEGAFIMGLGYVTSEKYVYDPSNGQLHSNDTWGYHVPTNKDIPVDFRVSLLKNSSNTPGVLRSKASGEPPLCMSCSVMFALRKCIELARLEVGNSDYFQLDAPVTVEKAQQLCLVKPAQFSIQ